MLRRKDTSAKVSPPTSTSASVPSPFYGKSIRPKSRQAPSGLFSCQTLCSVPVLLGIVVLLTLASYLFPKEDAAILAHQAYEAEQKLERDAHNWWGEHRGQQLPIPIDQHPHFQTPSKWIDGERKLKEKLRVLMARQQEGKDVGVPVLTRYLGEDVPAWPDETITEADWKALVEKKYEEMRIEEEAWKEKVAALLVAKKG